MLPLVLLLVASVAIGQRATPSRQLGLGGAVWGDLDANADQSWLLMVEAGHDDGGVKRITPKSVFIAPQLTSRMQRCREGFRYNATGHCVKVVRVDNQAQIQSILKRLQASSLKKNPPPRPLHLGPSVASNGPTHFSIPLAPHSLPKQDTTPPPKESMRVDVNSTTTNVTSQTSANGSSTEKPSESNTKTSNVASSSNPDIEGSGDDTSVSIPTNTFLTSEDLPMKEPLTQLITSTAGPLVTTLSTTSTSQHSSTSATPAIPEEPKVTTTFNHPKTPQALLNKLLQRVPVSSKVYETSSKGSLLDSALELEDPLPTERVIRSTTTEESMTTLYVENDERTDDFSGDGFVREDEPVTEVTTEEQESISLQPDTVDIEIVRVTSSNSTVVTPANGGSVKSSQSSPLVRLPESSNIDVGSVESSVGDTQPNGSVSKELPSKGSEEHIPSDQSSSALEEEHIPTDKLSAAPKDERIPLDQSSSALEDERIPLDQSSSALEDKHILTDKPSSSLEGKHIPTDKPSSSLEHLEIGNIPQIDVIHSSNAWSDVKGLEEIEEKIDSKIPPTEKVEQKESATLKASSFVRFPENTEHSRNEPVRFPEDGESSYWWLQTGWDKQENQPTILKFWSMIPALGDPRFRTEDLENIRAGGEINSKDHSSTGTETTNRAPISDFNIPENAALFKPLQHVVKESSGFDVGQNLKDTNIGEFYHVNHHGSNGRQSSPLHHHSSGKRPEVGDSGVKPIFDLGFSESINPSVTSESVRRFLQEGQPVVPINFRPGDSSRRAAAVDPPKVADAPFTEEFLYVPQQEYTEGYKQVGELYSSNISNNRQGRYFGR